MRMRTQMKNALRRLRVLERLPQFQPPPSVLKQIVDRALQQMSNDDLELLKQIVRDSQAGVGRTPSERESAMLTEQNATLDTEARRRGFKSFAEAQRKGR
jgi:hypothetical protein